jgi:DNA-binding NarL/FixJ family response regulator
VIRILIVDDHAIVRKGYLRIFSLEKDFEVVGEAADAASAAALLNEAEPDVALVDLSLGHTTGIHLIDTIKQRRPTTRVIVLSMHCTSAHVLRSLRAGADGYLSKNTDPEFVVNAIRDAAKGKKVFSPDAAESLATIATGGTNPLDELTAREFDIFSLAVQGKQVQDIANALFLSPRTIFNYLSAIRQKLNVRNDFELLHLAIQYGVVDAPS